jgi:hypothetical protein
MATAQEVASVYELYLGRTPSAEEVGWWVNTGADFSRISQDIRNSPEAQTYAANPANYENLINTLYQEQLGRTAEEEGLQNWVRALESGQSLAEVSQAINQSLEGQNFDTQFITSLYRQNLARNPEQAGFQWWLSMAQDAGYTPAELEAILQQSATVEQGDRGIIPGTAFTEMQLADLEADPYGGRYITNSIYDLLPDAVNLSTIGGRQAQFVNPVTQQPFVTSYGGSGSTWSQTTGLDVLNTPAVQAAVQRALDSGAMTPAEYRTMFADLQSATNMTDVYAAFNKPQAQVVIDAVQGQQIGEANTLAQAQSEAAQRQAVLSAQDPGFYQGNFALADAYRAAGLDFPFGRDAFSGYDTRTGQANLVTDANFNNQVGNLVNTLYGQFGGAQDMATPLSGQYYSEAGLQPGFTPFGAEGTTFRSGVAGYTPNLPTMFQFGAPPVDSSFQQYRPGAFQPAGVTTGGFITGYTADGQPIYSEYNNPSVNVPIPSQMAAAQAAYPTSPITAQNFDAAAYLAANPDVAAAGVDPYGHYMQWGQGEGRTATRLPFNYTQSSQLVNPSANLQTINATGMNQADFNAMMANYQAQQASNAGG